MSSVAAHVVLWIRDKVRPLAIPALPRSGRDRDLDDRDREPTRVSEWHQYWWLGM